MVVMKGEEIDKGLVREEKWNMLDKMIERYIGCKVSGEIEWLTKLRNGR